MHLDFLSVSFCNTQHHLPTITIYPTLSTTINIDDHFRAQFYKMLIHKIARNFYFGCLCFRYTTFSNFSFSFSCQIYICPICYGTTLACTHTHAHTCTPLDNAYAHSFLFLLLYIYKYLYISFKIFSLLIYTCFNENNWFVSFVLLVFYWGVFSLVIIIVLLF